MLATARVTKTKLFPTPLTQRSLVVVVVMMSPSGTAYMGGQRGPKEMRNSTRL